MNSTPKKYIRSFNTAVCFSIFGIGALGIGVIALPLIYIISRNKDRRRLLFCNFVSLSWKLFVQVMEVFGLIEVNISSKDRKTLGKIQSRIVAANHPSLIDIVILISLVKNPVCIVKGKLTKNIFMRIIILYAYINNNLSAEELIAQSVEALDKGYNLIIFPEGTRAAPGIESKLQRGAAYISIASKHPILPIHIKMSKQILGKHQKWYDLGEETISYEIIVKRELKPKSIIDNAKSPNINARMLTSLIKNNIY